MGSNSGRVCFGSLKKGFSTVRPCFVGHVKRLPVAVKHIDAGVPSVVPDQSSGPIKDYKKVLRHIPGLTNLIDTCGKKILE